MTRVLFVCLGNICRSPTAQGVFSRRVEAFGLGPRIEVDSCGTGDWHVGKAPDRRAIVEAARRGYDLRAMEARQVTKEDFDKFDYILAMDNQNLADLRDICPAHFKGRLELFLNFAPDVRETQVPDPYYSGDESFSRVFDLIEEASDGLLGEIMLADRG